MAYFFVAPFYPSGCRRLGQLEELLFRKRLGVLLLPWGIYVVDAKSIGYGGHFAELKETLKARIGCKKTIIKNSTILNGQVTCHNDRCSNTMKSICILFRIFFVQALGTLLLSISRSGSKHANQRWASSGADNNA
uniref:Uncharacterized protein n=1 Tax=Romanomermis culicivorax TaxID=13658 RepID=A0A915IHG8_ROMCU